MSVTELIALLGRQEPNLKVLLAHDCSGPIEVTEASKEEWFGERVLFLHGEPT